MAKNILFIVGSLRNGSFNHQLAQAIEQLLSERAKISYLHYVDIPFMNQDLEIPVQPAIARVREAVGQADALWLFSPVYNFSYPGVVKNLLDWLSRALDLSMPRGPSILQDKIITVSSAASGDAAFDALFTQYRTLLPFIRMQLVEPLTGVPINPEAWGSNKLVISEVSLAALTQQTEALLKVL